MNEHESILKTNVVKMQSMTLKMVHV